jgi:hypothetical protein
MSSFRARIERDGQVVCAGQATAGDWSLGRDWYGAMVVDDGTPPEAGAGYALVLADGRTFSVVINWVGAGAVTYEGLGHGPVDPAGAPGHDGCMDNRPHPGFHW